MNWFIRLVGKVLSMPSLGLTKLMTRYLVMSASRKLTAKITNKDDDDEKIRSTGIKCEYTLTIDGGTVTSNANGKYARAVRAGSLIANGGTLRATTTGDKSQGIKLDSASSYINNGGIVTPTPTF